MSILCEYPSHYQSLKPSFEAIRKIFAQDDHSIHKARNELKIIELDGIKTVVKAFKVPHLFNRIVYTYFRKSKAYKSYHNALRLEELEEYSKHNKRESDNEDNGKPGPVKTPEPDMRNMVLEIIRKRGGRSRTAAIWRCVKDAEQAGVSRDIFRKVVDGLVAGMAVQLAQGDLNQTPEAERDKLLWMDETINAPYCSIILTK